MTTDAVASPHPFRLDGRVALVTGAARGLGWCMAQALAQAGATVWLNGRDPALLDAAAQAIAPTLLQGAPPPRALPFDIADEAARARALARIEAEHGALHILVNNVGQRDRRPLEAFAPGDILRLLETNLVAPLLLARDAALRMPDGQRQPGLGGRIVNITSIAGPISRAGDAAYTVAKGGLDAATRALAAELGPRGIAVNTLAPGAIETDFGGGAVRDNAQLNAQVAGLTALGRVGLPDDIGGAVAAMLSEGNGWMNGQRVEVSGGMLL